MQQKEYVINRKTLAIIPRWNRYGEAYSEVHEEDRIVYVAKSALAIVVDSLHFNGQTLRGVQEGTRKLLGKIHLPPITLNEALGLYWFYTDAPYKNTGAWYALNGVRKAIKAPNGTTTVILTNGQQLHDSTGFRAFENKLKNASLLKTRREQYTVILLRYNRFSAEKKEDYEEEE